MTIEERKQAILERIDEIKEKGVDMKNALDYLEVEDK